MLLSLCCMSPQGCWGCREDRQTFQACYSTACQPRCPCGALFFCFLFINLTVYVIFCSKDHSFACLLFLWTSNPSPTSNLLPCSPKPLLNSLLSNQRENELPQHLEVVWMGIPFCLIKDMEESLNQDWNEACFSSVTEAYVHSFAPRSGLSLGWHQPGKCFFVLQRKQEYLLLL